MNFGSLTFFFSPLLLLLLVAVVADQKLEIYIYLLLFLIIGAFFLIRFCFVLVFVSPSYIPSPTLLTDTAQVQTFVLSETKKLRN